ncbi:uncharacterized protein LOC141660773 [Apium graveolens]|uniref:uncharacterized protein LOC141660773 n=1 Tax=Apium graveolens TaxID=4045 RepID=UPI003D7A1EEE
MWNKLVITYEGTLDIKDSRMDTLIQDYENFTLLEGETIIDMETRFTRIIDELAQLGKAYSTNKKNRRVLEALPPSWKVKFTTIKEMQNLNAYSIDSLFGNLRAYEEDNAPDKPLPKVEEKRKGMALKAILIDEDENDDELNKELENLDEQESALLTRQLRRVLQSKAQRYGKGFLKTGNQQRVFNSKGRPNYKNNFPTTSYAKGKGVQPHANNAYNNNNLNYSSNYAPPKPKEEIPEETQNVCFECKQPGHFKLECPKLSKGRVLVAESGWDLSEDEDTPEQSKEIVNLCLMALDDEKAPTKASTSIQEVTSKTLSISSNNVSLSIVDHFVMDISELRNLVNHLKIGYDELNGSYVKTKSEKDNLQDLCLEIQKEVTSLTEVHVKDMENVTEILTLSDRLKVDMNERDDYIRTLQVENVNLLLRAEEFENLKTHLEHCNCELNDELLKLKARNETLLRENLTHSDRINDLE